ncbi:hypothetical protein AT15_05895 [Kosmotoga arenicorallina S304]|uniref:Uncharacterized protein n=1 Tax=Kosmotoga arenicorallina S304 TaxID=1453497 RepID=A0A182C7J4_9BACT|nr:hypothetical protein [Kosmotoga arenicorallina]OAA31603.1 hypothetical protein AT15_05895 [Kosmotoga arenicorallina S304]
MFKRIKVVALISLIIVFAVYFLLWLSEFSKTPVEILSEYQHYVKDFVESRYAFKAGSLINTYEYNRSGYEKMSNFLLNDVKKLIYQPDDISSVFVAYYTSELENVNHELIILYNEAGRKVCDRVYIEGNDVLEDKDLKDTGIKLSKIEEMIQDGYFPVLVKSIGDGYEIVSELKKPRVYFLKKTFWGWKIDWLKSMEDLVEKTEL